MGLAVLRQKCGSTDCDPAYTPWNRICLIHSTGLLLLTAHNFLILLLNLLFPTSISAGNYSYLD